MGTNYYHHPEPAYPTCGHHKNPRHIGKSSGGWCFALHVYPDDGIHDLADWEALWASGEIRDEYGEAVDAAEMRCRITGRSGHPQPPDELWYRRNHAAPGPNNLARHAISHGCVGHGAGTWDLMVGDFS